AVARLMRIVRRAVKLDRPTARLLTERLLEYVNHNNPTRSADEWAEIWYRNFGRYAYKYDRVPILIKGREVSNTLKEVLGEERFDTLYQHYRKESIRNISAYFVVNQLDGYFQKKEPTFSTGSISRITKNLHELGKL
ncbi:MAG: hypothetical protein IIV91_06300, partial [Alistipes sp.]|nr:hypothetical protein [Alistipes sp.]